MQRHTISPGFTFNPQQLNIFNSMLNWQHSTLFEQSKYSIETDNII